MLFDLIDQTIKFVIIHDADDGISYLLHGYAQATCLLVGAGAAFVSHVT